MKAPLDGYRVWELGASPALGLAGRLLVEMGATVELIEPLEGSRLRSLPPFDEGGSALFRYLAAGKSSRRIPDEREVTRELATINIILHDSQSLPRGWDDAIRNASMPEHGRVIVACTAYGLQGPKADWQGEELTLFQAGGEGHLLPSGLAYEEAPERPPLGAGRYVANYQAGLTAALCALAGLRTARAAKRTEQVDISIQDAQLSLNHFTVSRYVDGVVESRATRSFNYGGVFRCLDGYVELLTLEEHQWEALRSMLGDPAWAADESYRDGISRARLGDDINAHLRQWTGERNVAEVVRSAAVAGVPCGPFVSPERLPEIPQLRERYFIDFRDGLTAGVSPGMPWQLDRWARSVHRPAPATRVATRT